MKLTPAQGLVLRAACDAIFPTTPGANPMGSIMAMARMTAESIITALRGGK